MAFRQRLNPATFILTRTFLNLHDDRELDRAAYG
jgi:hypothetical protein